MRGLKKLSYVLGAAFLLAIPAVSSAEVVAGWDFSPTTVGGPIAPNTPGYLSAQTPNAGTDSNINVSNLSATVPSASSYTAIYDNGSGTFFNVMEAYTSNYQSSELYDQFTINVNPGYVLNLTDLNATVGDGTTAQFSGSAAIESSLTGATVLGSGADEGVDSSFTETYGPYATYATTASADLTGSQFQGLTSADGPITFTIDITGENGGAGVQKLTLDGTVSASSVPEPASLSLLLIGGIPLMMRRARRTV
jgi:hypothetical protein